MKNMNPLLICTLLAAASTQSIPSADACTRVQYNGSDSLIVVARSLDWKTPIPTNLYVYPRGMEKKSSDLPGAITWKSKYGAVYAVGYDGGITEGMNEKGLVINGLFCKGTVYVNQENQNLPPMSMAMFIGWLLDLNATTDEVCEVLEKGNFRLGGATFDEGTASTLHWGITDSSGKSVILEYDHGQIKFYDMGDFRAMTNDPQWPSMTAIIDYWNNVGGKNMMPGTVSSPDRCVRANYFAHHVEAVGDADLGVVIASTVLRNAAVPYTYEIVDAPNLSSTQWCSYSDVRDLRYYFDIVTHPGYFYVDLHEVDLREGAPVLKLDTSLESSRLLIGDVSKHFKKSAPFTPMYQ